MVEAQQRKSLEDDVYSDVDSEEFVQDMRAYGVGQALPIDAEGISEEAAAYLRAVRAEASRIPHVTVSERLHPEDLCIADAQDAQPSLPPPQTDWTCTVVDNFVAAREQVQYDVAARTAPPDECAASIPFVGDRQGWKRYISQSDAQPYSATLARMDNTLAAFCLRCLADEQKAEDAALPAHTALWMYGLMVRLEKPVGPDVSCILRQVAQLAHARRSTLPPAPADDVGSRDAAMYDTLRVVAGGYFGQDQHLAPMVGEYLRRSGQL